MPDIGPLTNSSELRQLQQSFFAQLTGSISNIVDHIQSTADRSAGQRLDIYTSGYRLRLKEAIRTDFDRLYSYLGDEMFDSLMDAYIDKYKSRHASLRYYSGHLAEFLSQQQPFSNYPELQEIARIEQAFNSSFDAANCTTTGIETITEIAAEDWPALSLKFHASVHLLPLQTNSFPVWKALSEQQTPPASIEESATWVIWRKDLISRYRALPGPEAHTLKLALGGANFSELCENILDSVDEQLSEQRSEQRSAIQIITFLKVWILEKMVCQLG